MNLRHLSIPFLALLGGAFSCGATAPERPTVACGVAPAASGLPILQRASAIGDVAKPYAAPTESPAKFVCERSPRYKCHEVDELDAVEHGGANYSSPGGTSFVHACPTWPAGTVATREDPWHTDKPCGDAAKANVQLAMKSGDVTAHILFYDDPGCRAPLPGSTVKPPDLPYYRVREIVGIDWKGRGW